MTDTTRLDPRAAEQTPTTGRGRPRRLAALTAALVLGVGGGALLSDGLAAGSPADRAPAPQPQRATVRAAAVPADNQTTVCSGKTHRRTVVRTNDSPLYWTSGPQVIRQRITTTKAQKDELLVVTFSAETWVSASLAYLQADVRVDGVYAEPYDTVNPNAIKSGESYADASLTRCIRVKPGKHKVDVVFTSVGTGSMWIDDSALRIDQFD